MTPVLMATPRFVRAGKVWRFGGVALAAETADAAGVGVGVDGGVDVVLGLGVRGALGGENAGAFFGRGALRILK